MPIYAHFLWVVPGLVLSTLIGLSLLKFIRRLPAKAARGIIAGGVIFLAGHWVWKYFPACGASVTAKMLIINFG